MKNARNAFKTQRTLILSQSVLVVKHNLLTYDLQEPIIELFAMFDKTSVYNEKSK